MFQPFVNWISNFVGLQGGFAPLLFISVVGFGIGTFFALFRFIKSFNIFS